MVPEGWKLKVVDELCSFTNGNSFKASDWASHGLPIIRIQNLNGSSEFNYFSGQPRDSWLVESGDLLFAWAGTRGVSFGPCRWQGPRGVLNQHIYKVQEKKNVSKPWLYYALRRVTEKIEQRAHGFKATLLHVQKRDITDQLVPTPPYLEQQRIAKLFETWEKAIAATERLLAASEKQKKALMQQLLTGKKRLPGFSGEWKRKPIRDIATRVTRKSDGAEHPILTISSLSGFVRQDEKFNRYMAGKSVNNYILLKNGEFAYNKGNSKTYQFGCVFDLSEYETGLVPHVYVCFKLKEGYSRRFYKYLFEADYLKPQLGALVNTGVRNNGLLNIKPSEFLGMKVPTPSPREQEELAEVFEKASEEIRLIRAKLEALKLEKKALMQQLLTGKRRVKVSADNKEAAHG